MARRKKDTEKVIDFVVWLIIGIPMAIIAIFKWIFSFVEKANQQPTVPVKLEDYNRDDLLVPIALDEIDLMDGLSFEYFVANLLQKNGFTQVYVTRSSGDFGVDIIAYKDNKKYAFQCKNYQSKLGVAPIQEVYSGATKYGASVCVVVTNSYFTSHAQELAQSLNVKLWDRTELARLMKIGKNASLPKTALPPKKESERPVLITARQKLVKRLVVLLNYAANEKNKKQNEPKEINKKSAEEEEAFAMATTLGAGKYVFGVDIPEGKYNLRAISGSGGLEIQKLIDGTWEEEYMSFGVEKYNAQTYHGLSLPKNKYFEVSGNVVFEITKAKMIEIE